MSDANKIFHLHEELTEEYQHNFSKPGIIGYYSRVTEPEKRTYCLCLDSGEKIILGDSLESVDKHLQDIYYADQLDFWEPAKNPFETNVEAEQKEAVKITPKRRELLNQISKIKTWSRGVIAKIASNLGRKVGAVRQMLSVLTKKGLLVRIGRGQYALSSGQFAFV
jgi:hypothetical protein